MHRKVHDMLRRAVIAVLIGFSAVTLAAQSGDLYGMSLEESAILVRVINGRSSDEASIRLGSSRITVGDPGTMSPYQPLSADLYIIRHLGVATEFIPQPGTLYSILVDDAGVHILEDEAHQDPVRSQLYLYNAGDRALGLRTADGSTELIAPLQPGASAYRVINPVRVELVLFDESGETRSSVFIPELSRGESLGVVIMPESGSLFSVIQTAAEVRLP